MIASPGNKMQSVALNSIVRGKITIIIQNVGKREFDNINGLTLARCAMCIYMKLTHRSFFGDAARAFELVSFDSDSDVLIVKLKVRPVSSKPVTL